MGYISAITKAIKAEKRKRSIIQSKQGITMTAAPRIPSTGWRRTMEGHLFHSHPLEELIATEFDKQPQEVRDALRFAPCYKQGEWIARARFWQSILKPALEPKQYAIAIAVILKHFENCVKRNAHRPVEPVIELVKAWQYDPRGFDLKSMKPKRTSGNERSRPHRKVKKTALRIVGQLHTRCLTSGRLHGGMVTPPLFCCTGGRLWRMHKAKF